MIFLLIFIIIILLIIASFVFLTLRYQDLSFPELSLEIIKAKNKKVTNVLMVYPHPDDEVMSSGGLIRYLSKNKDFNLFVVSITKGEHGDEVLKVPPELLGMIRSDEFAEALDILDVKHYETWDFTDGGMPDEEKEYKKKIIEFINKNNIDSIITYEKFGMYGHPDHISLSKVVNEIAKDMNLKVLYSTLPTKILKRINLPKTLTYKDRVVELKIDKIAEPEFKLNIIPVIYLHYRAAKRYQSQAFNRKPLQFFVRSMIANFEYYTTKFDL